MTPGDTGAGAIKAGHAGPGGLRSDFWRFVVELLVIAGAVICLQTLVGPPYFASCLLCLALLGAIYALIAVAVVLLRYRNPAITAIRAQRWLEHVVSGRPTASQHTFMPLRDLPSYVVPALIAAEDPNFLLHKGIDWWQTRYKLAVSLAGQSRLVGGSTITQQLAKNLFLPGYRLYTRKVVELTLALLIDRLLSKWRIVELYVNNVEWGEGVFGIAAASMCYYGISATELTREQVARLVAVLPNPRVRTPATQNQTSARILSRMAARGW